MTDRDIGSLEARMDEHGKRFDRLESQVRDGFDQVNERLDALSTADSERRGASQMSRMLLRVILAITGAGGVWEIAKEFLHK